MKIPKPIGKLAQRVIDSVTGSGLMQEETGGWTEAFDSSPLN